MFDQGFFESRSCQKFQDGFWSKKARVPGDQETQKHSGQNITFISLIQKTWKNFSKKYSNFKSKQKSDRVEKTFFLNFFYYTIFA